MVFDHRELPGPGREEPIRLPTSCGGQWKRKNDAMEREQQRTQEFGAAPDTKSRAIATWLCEIGVNGNWLASEHAKKVAVAGNAKGQHSGMSAGRSARGGWADALMSARCRLTSHLGRMSCAYGHGALCQLLDQGCRLGHRRTKEDTSAFDYDRTAPVAVFKPPLRQRTSRIPCGLHLHCRSRPMRKANYRALRRATNRPPRCWRHGQKTDDVR